MSQYLEAEDKAKPTGMSEFYENAPHAGPSGSEEAAHDSLHQEVLMAGERQEKVIDSSVPLTRTHSQREVPN